MAEHADRASEDDRFDLDGALARVKGKGPALVLMHDNPDPDCMAAAEAMRVLLETCAGVDVTVARGGIIGRAENRAMVSELKLVHFAVEEIDFSSFPTIALVDTQPETGNNSLPRGHRVDIVVDHHPLRPASRRAPWCDIRDTYGASSTIVYSYLRRKQISIDARLATALVYAIRSETRNLVREASVHERQAYSELIVHTDFDKLNRIVDPKVPAVHFATLDRALRRAEIRGPLLVANLGELSYPDLVAEIADILLPYEDARWVMCVGHYRGAAYLSLRTDDPDGNAGTVIRRIVGKKGAAGGHGAIAGGKMFPPIKDDADLGPLYEELLENMLAELQLQNGEGKPLLPDEKASGPQKSAAPGANKRAAR